MAEASKVDSLLIRYYGNKSAEEIEELTGIPAMDVAKRTLEVLGKRDPLGEDARVQVLIIRLETMAEEIQKRLPEMSDRNVSAAVNSASGALGRVLKELREVRKESKIDVTAISETMGRILAELINIPIQHLRDELKERYATDDDEIDSIVEDGIRMAYDELESRVDS